MALVGTPVYPSPVQIFLVRHGQTESNRLGLALGRADVPLNEHGRWQAQRLGEALVGERLAAVYSSPLQRTWETAQAIAAAQGLEVTPEPRLIEMDIGQLDGLTFAKIRVRFPGLLEAWVSGPGPGVTMPGGERLIDVQERALDAVRELGERRPHESVCAVSHNFVILCLLTAALGIDLADFRRVRQSVGAISVLDVRQQRMRMLRLNDVCHLEVPG